MQLVRRTEQVLRMCDEHALHVDSSRAQRVKGGGGRVGGCMCCLRAGEPARRQFAEDRRARADMSGSED
eukprot:scaffold67377_cov28-Tisochrysis_lutea.AAC.3